jgi:hypothetical protein
MTTTTIDLCACGEKELQRSWSAVIVDGVLHKRSECEAERPMLSLVES